MTNQLKVLRFKAKRFWLFYIAMAVIAITGFAYGIKRLPDTTVNDIFAATICDTSFMFIMMLVVSWFSGNDFYNRTIHNEIKIGYTRGSVIFSRTFVTCFMSGVLQLVFVLATIIGHSVKWGFTIDVFNLTNLVWFFVVMLQICANVSIVMLIVFAIKNVAGGISLTVVFNIISCNILRNFISGRAFRLTCFSLAQDNHSDTLILSAIIAAATILVALTSTYFVFRRSEIK